MTTSDVAALQHDRNRQRCIRVVGRRGVGKRSLTTALGANVAVDANREGDGDDSGVAYDWRPAPALATVKVVVYEEPKQLNRSITSDDDVFVLCFDLSDSESFRAISDEWCPLLRRSRCRVVLVGTKCDEPSKRRVTAADAMELALVECDEFVEVGTTQPPFEGVMYLRQLLATWLTQDPLRSVGSSPLQSPSRENAARGVRSSVWLYDPTEEIDAEGQNADVKLRPISRALFEMREAGGDRAKSLDRRREQAVAKLVTRSRYYGPTESSRSQRWQAHQQQQQKQTTRSSERRRQSTTDIDVHDIERANLESKSFMQTTKLTQKRLEEMTVRTTTPEVAVKPRSSKSEKRKDRSRARAMSTMPASVLATRGGRPRTASLSPSNHSSHSPSIRPMFSLLDDDAAGEFALNLMSPGAEKVGSLPAPPPLAHITSPVPPVSSPGVQSLSYSSSSDESSDDDVFAIKPLSKSPARTPKPTTAGDKSDQEAEKEDDVKREDDSVFSTEIDDMLDYFDGITLPI